ncbi:MAG: hypothetical protein ACR2OD_08890 [Gaiellaceae bacterium]
MAERTITVTEGDLVSLSSKLNAIELSEPEQAALVRLFDLASEASGDVSGFARDRGSRGFIAEGHPPRFVVQEIIQPGKLWPIGMEQG